MKKYLLIIVVAIFSSCQRKKDEKQISGATDVKVSTVTDGAKVKQKYIETLSWIDDFKNFRMALYNKDLPKLKTYFTFPLNTESTAILTAVAAGNGKDIELADPALLSEKEFAAYYPEIFTEDFLQSVLKIKSEKLYKDGSATTEVFKGANRDHYMSLNHVTQGEELYFSLGYYDHATADVEEISEYNVIYVFKIIDGKYLRFDQILEAG